ncbi:TPA: hypothetical protein ACRMKK_006074, partial [Pseudomonas aeruginosa]
MYRYVKHGSDKRMQTASEASSLLGDVPSLYGNSTQSGTGNSRLPRPDGDEDRRQGNPKR